MDTIAIRKAGPLSHAPLPYSLSPTLLGVKGSYAGFQPSPAGYLSMCPYIINDSDFSQLEGISMKAKGGTPGSEYKVQVAPGIYYSLNHFSYTCIA